MVVMEMFCCYFYIIVVHSLIVIIYLGGFVVVMKMFHCYFDYSCTYIHTSIVNISTIKLIFIVLKNLL